LKFTTLKLTREINRPQTYSSQWLCCHQPPLTSASHGVCMAHKGHWWQWGGGTIGGWGNSVSNIASLIVSKEVTILYRYNRKGIVSQ